MMKQCLFPLVLLFFLFSCNGEKEEAQQSLDQAKAWYENAEYAKAKQVLDELKTKHPKQVEVLKEGLSLMRQIEWKEQERNLNYCDSMLIIRQAEADSIKQYFVFEKDPQYDETGRYIEKKMAASFSSQKLRTGVNEAGDIYLISVYSGASPIRHNQLKVSVATGEYTETEVIPYDGVVNYSLKDDNTGITHELVTYQKGKDKGVIQFICDHSDSQLTAQYRGGKNYSYLIPQSVIQSLTKSLEFSVILSDIQQLRKEKEKAEKRIEYLQGKLGH